MLLLTNSACREIASHFKVPFKKIKNSVLANNSASSILNAGEDSPYIKIELDDINLDFGVIKAEGSVVNIFIPSKFKKTDIYAEMKELFMHSKIQFTVFKSNKKDIFSIRKNNGVAGDSAINFNDNGEEYVVEPLREMLRTVFPVNTPE
jgi:hypothetical protein